MNHDPVNSPSYYTSNPGVECIDIAQHFDFVRGNVVKYLWRRDLKDDRATNLRKALWYLNRAMAPKSNNNVLYLNDQVTDPLVQTVVRTLYFGDLQSARDAVRAELERKLGT